MAEHLFVYGTLRQGHAPAEIADVVGLLTPVGRGKLKGTRYDLGSYPGVSVLGAREGSVSGEVYKLPNDPDALARLDEYEEFDPKRPNQSLFRRVRSAVTLKDGSRINCWVYLYNRPIPKMAKMLKSVGRSAAAARASR